MASRVNMKFAVSLAAAIIVIVVGVVGVAAFTLRSTGDEYIKMGDQAMAAGDIELAADNYEKAVGKDRTRIDWLEKWRAALIQLSPEAQVTYEKNFNKFYIGILEQMAVLEFSDPAPQKRLLDEKYQQAITLFPSSVGFWQGFADLVKQRVEPLSQSDPAARALWRYRGLAILAQMTLTDVDDNTKQEGLANLRTAIEADPTDVEAMRGIVIWHLLAWRKAYLDRRTIEARRLETELTDAMSEMLEAFPDHYESLLTSVELKIDQISVQETNDADEKAKIRELVGDEVPVVEAFRRADPAEITPTQLARLDIVLRRIGAPDRNEVMLELLDRSIAESPNNPRLVTLKTGILGNLRRNQDAIALIQEYLKVPIAPISLEGMIQRYYRPTALQKLAEQALAEWEQVKDPEKKKEALEIAKGALNELSTNTRGGEQSAEALTVQGKLAQAEGRTQEAVRIFTELVEKLGQNDPDTRWRLAQSLREANQLGASRQQLESILEDDPANLRALLTLAEIHAVLKEPDQARMVMSTIKELYPNVDGVDRAEERLESMIEGDPERDATRALIAQARSARANNTPEGLARALELIRPAFEADPGNVAITIELVDIETMRGQIAEARRVVTEALTYNPDNTTLIRLQRSMRFNDPYAAAVALIDDSEMTDAQKMVRKFILSERYNHPDDSARLVAEMKENFSKDPGVIEVLFNNALKTKDFQAARRYVAVAAEANADQANGLVFQGRMEIVEENYEDAVRTLRQAAEILPYSSKLLMLLGSTELRLGLVGDGLRTLAKAYNAKPDDSTVALRYAQTLTDLQRWREALDVSRAAVKLNPHNRDLRNMWLNLEDRAGDPAVALDERRSIYDAEPDDLANLKALAGLYIKAERWDDAAAAIDALERDGTSLDTALLRARLLALRGDVQGGQQVVEDYLASEPDDATADASPIVALADFLFEFGLNDEAEQLLLGARDRQSKETMEVDRRLGDYYFNAGRLEDSLGPYKAIIDAGADNDWRVTLRAAETLSSLNRFDDVIRTLDTMGEDGNTNVTAVLLRARVAAAQNDARTARSLFDRAVELKPNDPMPFIQRAQYNARDEGQFNDAIADLDQAIRLQPDLVLARRMKSELLASRGRQAEAISELRKAVEAAPESNDLRMLLVQYLVRIRDFPSAISFAEKTIADRPDDLSWVRIAGDLSARAAELATADDRRAEYWARAADHYDTLYKDDASDAAALRLANARLLQRQPDAAGALELVEGMSPESRARAEIEVLHARTLYAVGRQDEALAEVKSAFAKAASNLDVRIWYDQVSQMMGSALKAGRFAEDLTPNPEVRPIYELMQVVHLFTDPALQTQLLDRLAAVEDELPEPQDRVELLRYRGRILFQLQRYQESADAFAEAVGLASGDLEFNNNLAYLRSEFLNDLAGAIPPAEQAARIAPQNPNVLDTLGWTYFRNDQISKAQQALQTARQYATVPSEFIPIEIHLGRVFVAKNDLVQANRLYQSARERLQDAPGLNPLYSDDLESLRALLDQAE